MQHLDNDMDDLFQRAAENYPLRVDNADWENIVKRITDESQPAEIVVPVKNNIGKRIGIILIVLILTAGWFMFHNPNNPSHKQVLTKPPANKTNRKGIQIIKDNNLATAREESIDISAKKNGNINYQAKGITYRVDNPGKAIIKISAASGYNESPSYENKPGGAREIEKAFIDNTHFSTVENLKKPADNPAENLKHTREIIPLNTLNGYKDIIASDVNDQLKKDDDPVTSGKKKKEAESILSQKKRAYVGLLIGPDLSKVRSTAFNNTGFDASLVLGFRLNQKISFETGIGSNRKNYTSEGRLFKMDKIGPTMPNGMIINTLKSQSSLIEIPLKIKYDFINSGKSDFFMSGGISAYIMTEEKNHYNVTLNGIPEKITGVYEKNDYGLPAVVTIAIGYEHIFSKNINLRVEPFLKVPLQGMGVGSLPVTSAGVQVGITRSLK